MKGINEEIIKKILALLDKEKEGLTIAEISRKLKINRITVTKYVYYLLGAEKIKYREIGGAKLFYKK